MNFISDVKVPYLDLGAQYRDIKSEIDAAIARVFEHCQFILGAEVADFERAFASYCGTAECIALNSGTSALHLALLAAGVGPGDEVITVPFTFVASVAAILYTGARPVFVDIDQHSFTMNSELIEGVITPRSKAILPVHLFGQPANMAPIMETARRHGLIVIEDAAQAHGAKYQGKNVGSIGDMACFSFYPTKNLGAAGEGGAVTTDNRDFADKIRLLRDWGQDRKYHHVIRGFNYRMEGIQAAVLRVKLPHLDRWNLIRQTIALQYNHLLANCNVELPRVMSWATHVYHLYTLRTKNRDGCQSMLRAEGIQTGVHYSLPVHLQPGFADLGYLSGSFPNSEIAASEVLSLPIYPELPARAIEAVASAVRKATQTTI